MSPADPTVSGGTSASADDQFRTTAARRAPFRSSATPRPKALRIGVIQNGTVIEEKIIRRMENVTIGLYEKNTFVIPSPHLPGRFVLFEARGGRYILNAPGAVDGKIGTPRGLQDIGALGVKGKIPLDESMRGKISFGDTTLLFQFVAAPPVQPAPQLPASMRSGWLRSFASQWLFIAIVTASLLAHVVPLMALVMRDWPADQKGFDLDNKYFQFVLKAPDKKLIEQMAEKKVAQGDREAVREDEEVATPASDAAGAKKPKTAGKALTEEEKAELEAQRRARLEAQVSRAGLLAPIGSSGGGPAGSGTDLLAVGSVDSDIDAVMKSVTGVKYAQAGDTGGTLRTLSDSAGGGKVADIGAIRVSQADADLDTTGPTEKKVKPKTSLGPGEEIDGSGLLSITEVTKVIRSRITSIQMCYQKGLNKNYGLAGKLSVRFTIGTSGRVTKASVESDSLGDPAVAECVVSKFKSFVFTPPEGGSVEYVYPLVFKAGE
jgi:TonB family protein